MQLLKDSDGKKVHTIEMKHQDPINITVEILEQWLRGGRMPTTWQTFVQCLQKMSFYHILIKAHTQKAHFVMLISVSHYL